MTGSVCTVYLFLCLSQEAYPGQNVEITAMALDQFNHKTSAFVSVVAPVSEPYLLS